VKIFFWTADSSGCSMYRCAYVAHTLADRGHLVAYNQIMPQQFLREPEQLDVLVAQRTCNEGPSKWWQQLARKTARPLMVFELDDDLWHIDPSNKMAADFYTPERLQRLTENVRVADLVTVSTEPLADVVAQYNPNVRVLPNQVPAWLLEHKRPRNRDLLTLGWRGGASHHRDFGELARPLRRFLQHPANRGRVEFHCIGQDHTTRVATLNGRTRHTGWFQSNTDYLKAVDFDMALIPLRESQFNDSKSELAMLEMSALGIPSIATFTGPYARAGAPAYFVDPGDAKGWERELEAAVGDEVHRAWMGRRAREWVSGRTYEANVWRWEEAYGCVPAESAEAIAA
jgi:glycosyltransferase involved in cell wall biosynthesis